MLRTMNRKGSKFWPSPTEAILVLVSIFQILCEVNGQGIHHNLPDNLEIIDPKSLGLSGADLENFLGNVKLLPVEGNIGGPGGAKTQILTVGFDGNEKLNLDDFENLSTAGLGDGDKTVAEMAFRKFKDYFKNPEQAVAFDEAHPDAGISPKTTASTSPAPPPTTTLTVQQSSARPKQKKQRLRVSKRPIYSSTFRTTQDEPVTDRAIFQRPDEVQDYARVIQQFQAMSPTSAPAYSNVEVNKTFPSRPGEFSTGSFRQIVDTRNENPPAQSGRQPNHMMYWKTPTPTQPPTTAQEQYRPNVIHEHSVRFNIDTSNFQNEQHPQREPPASISNPTRQPEQTEYRTIIPDDIRVTAPSQSEVPQQQHHQRAFPHVQPHSSFQTVFNYPQSTQPPTNHVPSQQPQQVQSPQFQSQPQEQRPQFQPQPQELPQTQYQPEPQSTPQSQHQPQSQPQYQPQAQNPPQHQTFQQPQSVNQPQNPPQQHSQHQFREQEQHFRNPTKQTQLENQQYQPQQPQSQQQYRPQQQVQLQQQNQHQPQQSHPHSQDQSQARHPSQPQQHRHQPQAQPQQQQYQPQSQPQPQHYQPTPQSQQQQYQPPQQQQYQPPPQPQRDYSQSQYQQNRNAVHFEEPRKPDQQFLAQASTNPQHGDLNRDAPAAQENKQFPPTLQFPKQELQQLPTPANKPQPHATEQQYYNHQSSQLVEFTTPRSEPMGGVFQVTPSTPLIPLATHENAMKAYETQLHREKEIVQTQTQPPQHQQTDVNQQFNNNGNNRPQHQAPPPPNFVQQRNPNVRPLQKPFNGAAVGRGDRNPRPRPPTPRLIYQPDFNFRFQQPRQQQSSPQQVDPRQRPINSNHLTEQGQRGQLQHFGVGQNNGFQQATQNFQQQLPFQGNNGLEQVGGLRMEQTFQHPVGRGQRLEQNPNLRLRVQPPPTSYSMREDRIFRQHPIPPPNLNQAQASEVNVQRHVPAQMMMAPPSNALHSEANLYTQSMGYAVSSIKPAPLIGSFQL